MNELLPIVGGIAGLSTLILGVLAYFRWKPKHPIEVRAEEVKIDGGILANTRQLVDQYKDALEYKDKEWTERFETERRNRSDQEAKCDERIAKLNREVSEIRATVNRAKAKCEGGCFAKN